MAIRVLLVQDCIRGSDHAYGSILYSLLLTSTTDLIQFADSLNHVVETDTQNYYSNMVEDDVQTLRFLDLTVLKERIHFRTCSTFTNGFLLFI